MSQQWQYSGTYGQPEYNYNTAQTENDNTTKTTVNYSTTSTQQGQYQCSTPVPFTQIMQSYTTAYVGHQGQGSTKPFQPNFGTFQYTQLVYNANAQSNLYPEPATQYTQKEVKNQTQLGRNALGHQVDSTGSQKKSWNNLNDQQRPEEFRGYHNDSLPTQKTSWQNSSEPQKPKEFRGSHVDSLSSQKKSWQNLNEQQRPEEIRGHQVVSLPSQKRSWQSSNEQQRPEQFRSYEVDSLPIQQRNWQKSDEPQRPEEFRGRQVDSLPSQKKSCQSSNEQQRPEQFRSHQVDSLRNQKSNRQNSNESQRREEFRGYQVDSVPNQQRNWQNSDEPQRPEEFRGRQVDSLPSQKKSWQSSNEQQRPEQFRSYQVDSLRNQKRNWQNSNESQRREEFRGYQVDSVPNKKMSWQNSNEQQRPGQFRSYEVVFVPSQKRNWQNSNEPASQERLEEFRSHQVDSLPSQKRGWQNSNEAQRPEEFRGIQVNSQRNQMRSWQNSNKQQRPHENRDLHEPYSKKFAAQSIDNTKNTFEDENFQKKTKGDGLMKGLGSVMLDVVKNLDIMWIFKQPNPTKKEFRRALQNRLREIVNDEFLTPPDMLQRYRRVYPRKSDYDLYGKIKRKIAEPNYGIIARSNQDSDGPKSLQPEASRKWPKKKKKASKKRFRPASSIPPSKPQEGNNFSQPIQNRDFGGSSSYWESMKANKKKKKAMPLPPIPPGKIPSNLHGDKKAHVQQKRQQKEELATLPSYEVHPSIQKAMDKEADLVCALIEQQFKSFTSTQNKEIYQHVDQKECIDQCRKLVVHHVSKRISNSGVIVARIYGQPRLPSRTVLEAYLIKYGCLSLKKSVKSNFYAATFATYETVDKLCDVDTVVIGDSEVSFKHMHTAHKDKMNYTKAKMCRQKQINSMIKKSRVNLLSKDWQIQEEEEKSAEAADNSSDDVIFVEVPDTKVDLTEDDAMTDIESMESLNTAIEENLDAFRENSAGNGGKGNGNGGGNVAEGKGNDFSGKKEAGKGNAVTGKNEAAKGNAVNGKNEAGKGNAVSGKTVAGKENEGGKKYIADFGDIDIDDMDENDFEDY